MSRRAKTDKNPTKTDMNFGFEESWSDAARDMIRSMMSGQGILITDGDDRIEFCSDTLPSLLEVPKRVLKIRLARRTMIEFRAKRGDFGSDAFQRIEKVVGYFAPGIQKTLESVTPHGRIICTNATPLPNGGSIITFTDVSNVQHCAREMADRKRELQVAKEENEALVDNLQAVIDNIEYGVVFMNRDMRSDLINRAFREMWNMDKAFTDSCPHVRELMHYNRYSGIYNVPDDEFEAYVEERIEKVRAGDIPQCELTLKNGRILTYRCVALPDGRRMLTYFDITDFKESELELRRHAEAMEIIQNAIGSGLSWIDKDLKLRAWNAKCREILGFTETEIKIGDSLEDIFRYNALRGEYGEGDPEKLVSERIELARKFLPHDFERTRIDGTILRVEGFPVSEGGFVTVYTDVTEQRRDQQQIEFLAHHDALTGLANRVRFSKFLAEAKKNTRDKGESFAVICFDLDHFKDVNDTVGHDIGDGLLVELARRVSSVVAENDLFGRLGGDEFAIIQRNIKSNSQAGRLAQKVIDLAAEPFRIDGHEIAIGASAGISICKANCGCTDTDQILRQADLALYSVKSEGRGTYQYFKESMNVSLRERKGLESDLRRAIQEDEFRVFYQPQVDAATRKLVGVEALVRWEHPKRGLVGPAEFIDVAEETGYIREIGQYVLETACSDLLDWDDIRLSVNLSPVQFRKGPITKTVADILAATEFDPQRLELEITESVLLMENKETDAILKRFKDMGISIVMDDFGTGYSSLSYLRKFPFDKLKIDRNFIADMGHDRDSNTIVQSVIRLAKSLGMRLNAEGVETHLQADILSLEGCDELQGYFFGKPMPLDDLKNWYELRREAPVPLSSDTPKNPQRRPTRKAASSG